MKTPRYRNRLLINVALVVAGVFFTGTASAQVPAHGRYRCYQPPGYTVMAWFDIDASGISVHGDVPQPMRIDVAKRQLVLPPDALPPYRHGFYFPPGTAGGDAERVTIVLAARADLRPGQRVWAKLPRCYLTTH